eukprot:2002339-Rhodomonas_salina.3
MLVPADAIEFPAAAVDVLVITDAPEGMSMSLLSAYGMCGTEMAYGANSERTRQHTAPPTPW